MSTEQWQLYAKNLRTIKIETGEPVILEGQSIVLREVKAQTPFVECGAVDMIFE